MACAWLSQCLYLRTIFRSELQIINKFVERGAAFFALAHPQH